MAARLRDRLKPFAGSEARVMGQALQLAATCNVFTVAHHLTTARTHRLFRAEAFATWREAAGVCT